MKYKLLMFMLVLMYSVFGCSLKEAKNDNAPSLGILAYLAQASSSQGSGGGGSYTAYGTTSCAVGWTVAYTGNVYSNAVVNGGAGAVFCSVSTGQYMPAVGVGNPFVTPLRLNGSGANLTCAVCVK